MYSAIELKSSYHLFGGRTVMVLDASGYLYLHGDHLDSVSATTRVDATLVSQQEFDPWGAVRSGSVPGTTRNFTGQLRDSTGLLFYNARYGVCVATERIRS